MVNPLQQVPATLYVAALTALISAIATLSGIFITNQANNERLNLQLRHEQNEKHKELIRNKLEELYSLFKQWHTNISIVYLNRTSAMAGELDYKSALEMDINREEKRTTDFSRLEMLIDLYFPRLKPDYAKVIEARDMASEIMLSYENQYLLGDIDGKKTLNPFLKAQNNFDEEIDKFTKLVAEQAEHI
jgi:hypothetical protein